MYTKYKTHYTVYTQHNQLNKKYLAIWQYGIGLKNCVADFVVGETTQTRFWATLID